MILSCSLYIKLKDIDDDDNTNERDWHLSASATTPILIKRNSSVNKQNNINDFHHHNIEPLTEGVSLIYGQEQCPIHCTKNRYNFNNYTQMDNIVGGVHPLDVNL